MTKLENSDSEIVSIDKSISSPIRRLYRKLSSRKFQMKWNMSPNGDVEFDIIQRIFGYFDEDGDGKISAEELEKCVRIVGGEMTVEEAELAVRVSDSDGDGKLGLEDFTKLMESSGEEERNGELKEAFEMYAVEGGEFITPKSLKKMLSRLGESTSIDNCKSMTTKFDLNGDGILDFHEFKIMMH